MTDRKSSRDRLGSKIDSAQTEDYRATGYPDLSTSSRPPGGLDPAIDATASPSPHSDQEPYRIGPYRILRVLGEGGMGTVYLAQQNEPIHRRVALKLIRAGIVESEAIRRFEAEREALARMSHPNIAQVFEAGTTEEGQPYFVFEHIPGLKITAYCDRHRLSVQARLELFIKVCEGVQHAHQKGVIHRDIKPSNILVTEVQDRPIAKIIDFGIAKALDQPLTEGTIFTGDRLIGTPSHLSPEAINVSEGGLDIDTRSDVYALGLLLYELLVGVLPFEFQGASFLQIARRITQEEAPRPSLRFTSLEDKAATAAAARRQATSTALHRRLLGDLDWITAKAISKERSGRYASAAALAADVERHLKHQPVLAGPPSPSYRMRKFIRRHKTGVASALLITLTLVAGVIGRTLEANRANREAQRANLEAQRANREAKASQQVADFLVEIFEIADPFEAGANESLAADMTTREILDRGARRIENELRDQPAVQARLLNTIGVVYKSLGLYEDAAPLLREALKTQREVLSEEDIAVAKSLHDLADLLWREGEYTAAEPLHREALELRRQLLGEQHLDVAESLNDLAVVLHHKGDYESAELLFLETLAMKRRLLGNEHPKVALSLNNLASLLMLRDDFEGAEPLLREALAMYRRLLGEEHPEVANTLNNLAFVLHSQGDYGAAEPLHREALAMHRRLLGEKHPGVATSLNNLALVLHARRDYRGAEPLYRDALARFLISLGDSHPNVAVLRTNLARLLADKGEFVAAEAGIRQALRVFREALPKDHWRIANAESVLGACLSGVQRYPEAEPFLVNSYATLRNKKGDRASYTREALQRIIFHYEARGNADKAAEFRALLPVPDEP